MSEVLNVDLTEDFDRVPDPIVPAQRAPEKETVIVALDPSIPATNDITADELFDKVVPGEVPLLDSSKPFQIMEDQVRATGQVYRIGEGIRASGRVSTESVDQAKVILASMGNDSPASRLNSRLFTQEPSPTNAKMAMNQINDAVVLQCDNLESSLKDLATNYLDKGAAVPEQALARFTVKATLYNQHLATLLHECGEPEFSEVRFLFNGGLSLKMLMNQAIYSYPDESTASFDARLDEYRATVIHDSALALAHEIRVGANMTYIGEAAGTKAQVTISNRTWDLTAAGLSNPTTAGSEMLTGCTLSGAIAGLGNGNVYSWVLVFIETIKTSHNSVRALLATLASEEVSEASDERLVALLALSGQINAAVSTAQLALSQIAQIDNLFDLALNVICKVGGLKLGEPLVVNQEAFKAKA